MSFHVLDHDYFFFLSIFFKLLNAIPQEIKPITPNIVKNTCNIIFTPLFGI